MKRLSVILLALAMIGAGFLLEGSTLGTPAKAQAANVSVTVGGFAIADNGPNDLNPAIGTIRFDSGAAAPAGFALPAGCSVSLVRGTVTLGGGGALVGLLGGAANIVNLTDLFAVKWAGAGGGALAISFNHTFAGPPAPAFAADAIVGELDDAILPWWVGAGTSVSWQAFVGVVPIAPPAGPVVVAIPAAVPGPVPVAGAHGVMAVPPPAGPPWNLRGELSVTLAVVGDLLRLPGSAEVGVAYELPPDIGGILELAVDGSDAPHSAAAGSGSSAPPYAAFAGAATAAALALVTGGWYARRRLS